MRYADGPTHEETIDVDRPPEDVWSVVIDLNGLAPKSNEFLGGEWLEPPALGSRFVGHNRHHRGFEWTTISTAVEFDPPRVFSWSVGDVDHPAAQWWFMIQPVGAGGSRVTQKVRLGPGPSGLTPAIEAMPDKEEKIVTNRLRELGENMRSTLAGVKELAEG